MTVCLISPPSWKPRTCGTCIIQWSMCAAKTMAERRKDVDDSLQHDRDTENKKEAIARKIPPVTIPASDLYERKMRSYSRENSTPTTPSSPLSAVRSQVRSQVRRTDNDSLSFFEEKAREMERSLSPKGSVHVAHHVQAVVHSRGPRDAQTAREHMPPAVSLVSKLCILAMSLVSYVCAAAGVTC